jgi:hypothetical protein
MNCCRQTGKMAVATGEAGRMGTGDAREGEGLVDFQRIKHRIL